MSKTKKTLALACSAVALATGVLTATPANALTSPDGGSYNWLIPGNGIPGRWCDKSDNAGYVIKYFVDDTGAGNGAGYSKADAVADAKAAAAKWEATTGGKLDLEYGGYKKATVNGGGWDPATTSRYTINLTFAAPSGAPSGYNTSVLGGSMTGYAGLRVESGGTAATRNVAVKGGGVLDAPQMAGMSTGKRRVVILHELGHVLGLDHVNNASEVMNGSTTKSGLDGVFGKGDRYAVNTLSQLYCVRV